MKYVVYTLYTHRKNVQGQMIQKQIKEKRYDMAGSC